MREENSMIAAFFVSDSALCKKGGARLAGSKNRSRKLDAPNEMGWPEKGGNEGRDGPLELETRLD
jgi:hypothetical protein